MSRYKVLKSVAHNIGHSFTSLMNYSGDDYVMGHVLRLARNTGQDTLRIDFVTGEAGPTELLVEPISHVPENYTRFFWDLVRRHGSDRSLVSAATLTLHYDLATQRRRYSGSEEAESAYRCEVVITDSRGKVYESQFRGWWYPEAGKTKKHSWWRFWG